MGIQRNKVAPTTTTNQGSPEVINVNEGNEVPSNAPATGPQLVPDASASSGATPDATATGKRRGAPKGPRGPQLTWGQVVNGDPKLLQKTVVEVARDVHTKFNGRATLMDVVNGLKAHSVFTDNTNADGIPLSDLVTVTNVRNKWNELRTNYSIGWAMKSEDKGGLGLGGSMEEVAAQLTDAQWAQMEDQIAKPKPEGLNFPKLIIVRGRKGQTLDMNDI